MVPDPAPGAGAILLLLVVYCSLVALPIGLAGGFVAGWLTPRVSIALGVCVGCASGMLGIGFNALVLWMTIQSDANIQSTGDDLFPIMVFGPGLIAVVAPIVMLQLVRSWRSRSN